MEYATIVFLLKARRRPLRTIEATEFKHIFPVGAGNGEAVVHSPPDSPARAAGYTKVHMYAYRSVCVDWYACQLFRLTDISCNLHNVGTGRILILSFEQIM